MIAKILTSTGCWLSKWPWLSQSLHLERFNIMRQGVGKTAFVIFPDVPPKWTNILPCYQGRPHNFTHANSTQKNLGFEPPALEMEYYPLCTERHIFPFHLPSWPQGPSYPKEGSTPLLLALLLLRSCGRFGDQFVMQLPETHLGCEVTLNPFKCKAHSYII